VSTLLNLASQLIPVGTQNFGPYSVVPYRGQNVQCVLQASVWPSSGLVATVNITFDTGDMAGGIFNGGAVPNAKGHYPSIAVSVPPLASSATVQIIVSQAFTSPVVVNTF
jgi:hypothetical protein